MNTRINKYLIGLFLALLTISCQYINNSEKENTSQEEKKNKEKFSGEKKKYWENGKLKAIFNYVDGKREGENRNYSRTGKLQSIVHYSNDMLHGESRQFYPDGSLNSIIEYEKNAKHGKEVWYYEDGTLYRESQYKHGKLDGVRKMYYNTGKLLSVSYYKDGQPGLGLKEYKKDGTARTTPYIVVEEINNLDESGEYIVKLSLSDNSVTTKFYTGELTDDKYFNPFVSPIPVKNGTATTVFKIQKGSILMHKMNVIAKKKTTLRGELVLQKTVNLAVENR